MLNINGKKFCEHCFTEIRTNDGVCHFCSYPRNNEKYPTALSEGTILAGRYVVGRVLGKGGFGITYLCYDSKDRTKVAIKEYLPDSLTHRNTGETYVSTYGGESEEYFKKGAQKFYDEAKLVSRFNGNPNIISVYEFFYENNTTYFVMEYLDGKDLKHYVKEINGKITEEEALYIAQRVTEALMIVHSTEVLHRDISPDNIFLCNDGKVKLIDFGAARQVIGEASKSLSVILKQGFAPLEQYQKRGKQGPWTDIYALGASLCYALTGETIDDAMTRITDDNVSFEGISSEFAGILQKMLAVRIEDRYQDTFELKNALNKVSIKPEPIVIMVPENQDEPVTVAEKPVDDEVAVVDNIENNEKANEAETEKQPEVIPEVTPEVISEEIPEVMPAEKTETMPAEKTEIIPEVKPENKTKKQKRKTIIGIICALAAVLIVLVGVAIVTYNKNNDADINSGSDWQKTEQSTVLSPSVTESLVSETEATTVEEKTAKEEKVTKEEEKKTTKKAVTKLSVDKSRSSIAVGIYHTVGLKADGTVVATGSNEYGQCNVSNWKNIISVAAGDTFTLGLKADGTVVATGKNCCGQINVSDWKNITNICVGNHHTVGLKSDGTVVAVGNNGHQQCDVSGWKNIVSIAAGDYYTIGIKSDGTVVSVGDNCCNQLNVSGWKSIVDVAAGHHTIGLKSDGTVVTTGINNSGRLNVTDWKKIVNIAAGESHTVGLKSDGTVVATGKNENDQCKVSAWKNVVAVYAKKNQTVAIRSDGTVVATGSNEYGQCNVSDWKNIKISGYSR